MITTIFFIIPKIIRQTFKENWINIQKTISAIRNKFWAVWYYYSIFFLTKKRETKSIMNLVNLFYSLDYCKKKFVSLVQKVLTKKTTGKKVIYLSLRSHCRHTFIATVYRKMTLQFRPWIDILKNLSKIVQIQCNICFEISSFFLHRNSNPKLISWKSSRNNFFIKIFQWKKNYITMHIMIS